MPLALSTGQQVGLIVFAGLFVVFAIASAWLVPKRYPNYPGDRVGLFTVASILLFLAMLGAVLAFARESEEAEGAAGHGEEPAETQPAETGPAETAPPEGEEPPAAEGDAEAGAGVFTEAGCGGCHALEAAGSSGNIGPNLDESQPDFALVVDRVTNGAGAMPSFSDQLSEEQIQDVAAYVVESTGGE